MRDKLLNGEIFYTLAEAKVFIETWRRHYNTKRPAFLAGLQASGPRDPAVAGFAMRLSYAGHTSRSP